MPHREQARLPKSEGWAFRRLRANAGRLAHSARRTERRRSIVLGTVAAVVIASPFAAGALHAKVRNDDVAVTRESTVAVPTQIAKIVLASMPDVVIPLGQLTGLNLPDLHVADLKKLQLPANVPVPEGTNGTLAQVTGLLPAGATLSELAQLLRTDALAGAPKLSDPASPVAAELLPRDIVDTFGATVKELTHSSPFSLVGVTARDLANADIRIRAKKPDNSWSPWYSADNLVGASAGDPQTGTEPIYVGNTNTVQLLVGRKSADAPAPIAEDVNVALIAPGSNPADGMLQDAALPAAGNGPRFISRAQWGADESIRCQDPQYDDFIAGAAVHHTAGNNDYTQAESAGIVRAIYAYHAQTMGWCDIGYNALVDKYGQIFEGRAGGIDRPVQAAHAGGFNENTVGVAMMGDFETEAPSDAAIEATGQFLGWRLKSANLDPKGQTKMISEGTNFTPYPEGAEVDLPVIFAHRDVGNTTCPGDAAYAQMDRIRDIAANSGAPIPPSPDVSPNVLAAAPAPDQAKIDIPGLIDTLVRATDDNPISQAWVAQGGANGPLGQALSGLIEAAGGNHYAKFENGYIYSVPGGQVVTLVGQILQTFIGLGLDGGELGLPLTNEYKVPGGLRADFERGSLIFNEITGFVQKIISTYDQSYADAYNKAAAPVAAPESIPAQPAVLAPAQAPGEQPTPGLKIPTLEEVAPAAEPVSAPVPARPQTNESIVPVP